MARQHAATKYIYCGAKAWLACVAFAVKSSLVCDSSRPALSRQSAHEAPPRDASKCPSIQITGMAAAFHFLATMCQWQGSGHITADRRVPLFSARLATTE
ncbi:hypothetical protein IF1G_03375 [Cordyceps javanica]|uniref:Uncharacterized protein n=1 Tax=Cordyceps javanica TaxID=43265 RepID=A0A545V7E0_9HYPO|nr:hypothetical protein IF1G_03375 [Cordyceps javanica]